MTWFFTCDHGVVGRCPVCGSLAAPRRATEPLRRADETARDGGRGAWWRRRTDR